MACDFRITRRVEFSDTDMAGIVHFSNYYRFMEAAEHAFLRSLGFSVHAEVDGQWIAWPRVQCECKYESPLRFEDEVEVHLLVREKRRATITYEFHIRKVGSPQLAARGAVTVVCCTMNKDNGQMTSITIPEWISRRIDVASAELLNADC